MKQFYLLQKIFLAKRATQELQLQISQRNLKSLNQHCITILRIKWKFLRTLYSMTFGELLSAFEEVTNLDLPPDEKFKKLIENQVNVISRNANRAKIYFGDYKEFPRKVRNKIKEKRRRLNEEWIDIYKEGVEAGLFQNIDAKIAVYVIVGACNWIQMWFSRDGALTESELGNITVELLSKGFLTKS